MNDDDAPLTREQMKRFELEIAEPFKEHEREKRRGLEIGAGFYEKIATLSAGSMAVCASIILAITAKSDIHSGSNRIVVHYLILIANLFGAAFLLAVLHNFLAAQVVKLDVAISEAQFQRILLTKVGLFARESTPSINDATMEQVEDALREQISPKQASRVRRRDFLYQCVNWTGYFSILAFGGTFALVLFYLHQLW